MTEGVELDGGHADPIPAAVADDRYERAAGPRGTVVAKKASAAVVDQFVVAGGSLVLQILAARSLGTSGFGAFALYNATLTLLTALETGWVGDSLTVLDRFDQRVRSALIGSHLVFVGVSFGVATAISLSLGLAGLSGAMWFALMVVLWMTEEVGRRIFMARLEFGHLLLNDTIDSVVPIVALVVMRITLGYVSLDLIVIAMAIGSLASILAALVQLPRHETRRGPWTRGGAAETVGFAFWRSAQTGIRPLALLLVRVLVAAIAGTAALGEVEAARLIVAPPLTFVSGAGSFLLPLYAEDERGRRRHSIPIGVAMAVLMGAVALYGVVAVVFIGRLTHLLTAGKFPIDTMTVVGWTVFAAGFAAGLPPTFVLVARREAARVFWIRVIDSIIGLSIVIVLIEVVSAQSAPWGIAAGILVGSTWLTVAAYRPAKNRPRPDVLEREPDESAHGDGSDVPELSGTPDPSSTAEVEGSTEAGGLRESDPAAALAGDVGSNDQAVAEIVEEESDTWVWTGSKWQKQSFGASAAVASDAAQRPGTEA